MNIYDLLDEQERLSRVYETQRKWIFTATAQKIQVELDQLKADIAEEMKRERQGVPA